MVKIENWNGHKIRFVEHEGEWWAVAKDVSDALGYRDAYNMARNLDTEEKATHIVSTPGGKQEMTVISETGIYEAIFNSQKPEAKEFKKWVKNILKALREALGHTNVFDFVADKEHQKSVMAYINNSIEKISKKDFIKANTIANKATSNLFGYPKMINKEDMTPEMLTKRQSILEDTAELMTVKEKFGLNLSVSEQIYNKYHN